MNILNVFAVAFAFWAGQAQAGDQALLDITNDLTRDVVRVSVNTDSDGAISSFEVGNQSFGLSQLKAGAKLVYKKIFLLTVRSRDLDSRAGGGVDLICAAGSNKLLRLQLKQNSNGRWGAYVKGRSVRELKLILELNWRMQPVGAKDIEVEY